MGKEEKEKEEKGSLKRRGRREKRDEERGERKEKEERRYITSIGSLSGFAFSFFVDMTREIIVGGFNLRDSDNYNDGCYDDSM